jgi:hypothetical protein
MEAVIQSIRPEKDETIQRLVENVVTRVIHETQSLQKACQETTACHEATEAGTEKTETDPGMMQSKEKHQEIPRGEAAVMSVRGLRKLCRVRNLAAERRQKPKERTRGYCGSRKTVTVAGRRTSRHASVAWRKRNLCRRIGTLEKCGRRKDFPAAGMRTTGVQEWHGTRRTSSENIGLGTMLNKKPRKDGRLGRDVGSACDATMA